MIKVKVNNEYKDVVKIFCGGTLQKEITKVWSREAQEYVYESSVKYTGTLPITISANGDALLDYRIYGADGGVGVATENLIRQVTVTQRVYLVNKKYCLSKYVDVASFFNRVTISVYDANDVRIFNDYIGNWRSLTYDNTGGQGAYADITISYLYDDFKASFVVGESDSVEVPYPTSYIPYGYKLPMTTIKNLFNPDGTYETNKYKDNDGTIHSYNGAGYYTQYMPINSEDLISVKNARGDSNLTIRLYYYDSQKNWIGRSSGNGYVTDFTATPIAGAAFIQLQLGMRYTANADKIIISQGRTTTPVYIGENQLTEGEYVSYGEQKIYRDVDGTLTPTDPPVPLPEIPTIEGTTVIDYGGTPKPSQMYVKYRR